MKTEDLIEKLKKNKVCFGLLGKDEQECLREVGLGNCEVRWCGEWTWSLVINFDGDFTYRIAASYQPKPKEKKLDVFTHNYQVKFDGPTGPTRLVRALELPNLIAFEYENGARSFSPRYTDVKYGPALIPKYVVIEYK